MLKKKNNTNDNKDNSKPSLFYRFSNYFIKEGYKTFAFFVIFVLVLTYPLPYYVFTSGGITDLSNRFEIEGAYKQEGTYNLSYVNQANGSVLTCLMSLVIPGWELTEVQNYQISEDESLEEMAIRDRLSLTKANQSAVILAYNKAGKEVKKNSTKFYTYAIYDFLESDKKIKVGDILISVNDTKIEEFQLIRDIISSKNVGDTVKMTFDRNGESYDTLVKVQELDGSKITGIAFYPIYDLELTPNIKFTFKQSESGPSAGFMTALAIYDSLIPEDLTNGLKIAGTGEIDENGNIGEIGGVTYKIAGAEKGGADIFFVPSGENYKDAKAAKEKYGYDITLVEVKTIDDAILYLKNYKKGKE